MTCSLFPRTLPGLMFTVLATLLTCLTPSWAEVSHGQGSLAKASVVIHCNYAPVTFWDKNANKPSGFAVDIIDSVAGRAGLQVSYICKNGWPEMITSVMTNEADISVLLKSEEREKTLLYSSPIAVTYLSYFARSQSSMDPDKVPAGYTVGVIRGSRAYEQLKNLLGTKISVVNSYQEGVFSLLAGEIDLFAGEESLVVKQAREARLEDRIKRIGQPFSEQERGLVVRKGNVQLLSLLNNALQGFIGSPEHQRIYLKWYGTPAPYWTTDKILVAGGLFLLIAICGMAYWRYKSIFRINRELVRTIDERKRTDEQYRAIVENQLEFVDRYLPGGILTYVNDPLARYFGMRPEEMVGKSFYPFLHEEDRKGLVSKLESATREQPFFTTENRAILRDGTVHWHQWTHRAFFDEQGRVIEYQSVGRDITERKQMEEALQQSEKRYRQLFENMQEGFMIQDIIEDGAGRPVDVRYLDINPAIERFLGKSRAEIVGRTRSQVLGIPDPAVVEANSRVAATGQPFRMIRYSSGAKRWYESFSYSFGPGQVATLVVDITERKHAEEKIRESEDKFRSIFAQAIDGIMIADAETKRLIEANKAMCGMLGYARDEIVGLSVDDIHPKKDLPAIRRLFERQLRGEISLIVDVPMLRKDGSVFYADINATHVILGGKDCLVGIFRDITKRKQAETVLKMREKQLAESQRIAHVGSWERNLETGQVFWSDELFRLLGLDPGKDPADFNLLVEMIHPDDRPELKKAIEVTLQQHVPYSIDYRFVLRDSTVRIIHAQAELIPDESGKLVILSGTAQDITIQKRAEEKIQQSEQFIRGILDTVDEGFLVIDPDYRILTANKAYCKQVSLPCDDVIGKHCHEISHKSSRPCYEEGEECAVRQVFATGKPHTALHKHIDGEGHVLYVETKGFPIKDESGRVTSVIETISNITEKHLLEEERLRSQKLEAIGTLAGGIAHDFNNLLQGVFGYISLARLKRDDKEKSLAALEEAEKALHLSVRLTNQLLTFSKGGKPVKRRIDLRPVIENAAKFALSGSRSGCRMVIEDGLYQAEVDEGQISQVIQNIVLNADQAMPEGGQIEITAKNILPSDKALPNGLPNGSYLVIVVKDSGVGISEHYLSKIFDPYFTTKEKGSGLGLATSYSIIKNHNGMIDVVSEKNKGATFSIYLPASAAIQIEEHAGPIATSIAGRSGRVLLMDDEPVIRDVAGELIKALGHKVEFAAHGREAIDKYQAARYLGKPFDIVILDLTIRGGMGGAETFQKLREIDPEVKAIVSSGYSDDTITSNYGELGFKAFLKKPYNVEDLDEVLSRILSR